jgi:hypothetical protein
MEKDLENESNRASLKALTAAGFVSSVLCVFLGNADNHALLPGAIFGISLAIYFVVAEDFRTPFRLLAFVCACSASYPLSMWGAVGSGIALNPVLGDLTELKRAGVPLIFMFVAGWIGAGIVLFCGVLLFGPAELRRKPLGTTFSCTLVGGLLGLSGAEIDRLLLPSQFTQAGVYVIWQTGIALLLGLLLRWLRGPAAIAWKQSQPRQDGAATREINFAAGFVLACVIATFGFFVYVAVKVYLQKERRMGLISKVMADEPSRAGLEGPEALNAEQLFVMHDVGGLRPIYPMMNVSTTWKSSAPLSRVSTIGYGIDVPNSIPSLQRKVYVQVLQLPNVEWARYQVRYAATQESADCRSCVSGLAKFGNQITQISQGANVSYLWSSGNLVVSVTKERSANEIAARVRASGIDAAEEEVLRLYLEKYPNNPSLSKVDP